MVSVPPCLVFPVSNYTSCWLHWQNCSGRHLPATVTPILCLSRHILPYRQQYFFLQFVVVVWYSVYFFFNFQKVCSSGRVTQPEWESRKIENYYDNTEWLLPGLGWGTTVLV